MNKGLALLFFFLWSFGSKSQPCTSPISTFPYSQGFEADNGGWVASGTASDWAWGIPSKPVITGAAEGVKCWTTGGLTGGSYNNSEYSYLTGPCFNFTSLQYPIISFKVFWETERKYDGAKLQYTTNNGTTWSDVGDINSNSNPCNAQNWYNYSPVTYLSNSTGWSGNRQPTSGSCLGGGGSNQWVLAKHTLAFLAGQPQVRFRFVFAAGSSCNNYDGFAFDELYIGEAPLNTASFTYLCSGSSYNFTATAPCSNAVNWNFGDPASSASNTASGTAPTHNFSGPGTYTVTMTASYPNSAPVVVSNTVSILGATATVAQPILCNGAQGIVSVVATGGSGYTYSWNTTPAQTGSSAMVTAGNYIVTVSAPNACAVTSSVSISQPPTLNMGTPTIVNASCSQYNGSISIAPSGGTAPYTYLWSNGANTSQISNLAAGNYSVTITDANGCTAALNNLTVNATTPATLTINSVCGANSTVNFSASANCATSLNWNFGDAASGANNTATGATVTHTYSSPGSYTVTLTANNSSGSPTIQTATVTILSAIATITQPILCSGNQGTVSVTPTGGSNYNYSWNTTPVQTGANASVPAGTYTVQVTAPNACATSATVSITAPPAFIISTNITDASCSQSNGSITTQVSGGRLPYSYSWSNGATTSSISNVGSGIYSVTIRDANNCSITKSNLEVKNNLPGGRPNLGNDTTFCTGSVSLNPGSFATYLWQNGSTNPTFTASNSGIYYVQVSDAAGCIASDTIRITQYCPPTPIYNGIYFPSAFTPNGDGLNDGFAPIGNLAAISNYQLFVYNRYGQLVFSSTNPTQKWNGLDGKHGYTIGAYVYRAVYKWNGKNEAVKGTVLLVR